MNEFDELARRIVGGYRKKLDSVGNHLKGQLVKEASKRKIRAKGDFINNMSHEVSETKTGLVLRLGSRVDHAKYVLGGKVPSWTPIAPLLEWIEDRKIVWWDGNRKMKDKEIAFLIARKHSRQGIEERNIVRDVVDRREGWIRRQVASMGGKG